MTRDDANPGFVRNALTVSGLTLVSRLLGLVRDLVLGRLFGDTLLGSSFAAAFAIPNLFRRLFGEGALSAAFLPEYAQRLKHDPELAARFASRTFAIVALVTGVLLVVGELILLAVTLLAGEDAGERVLSIRLMMVTLPYMPLVCAVALLGGILQTHGRFAPTAAAPVVLNLCMIAGALARVIGVSVEGTAFVVAGFVVLAGVLQVAWALVVLRRFVRWTRDWSGTDEPIRTTGRRFVPALVGLGTLQINSFLDTLIAMWPIWVGPLFFGMVYPLDAGSNSILFYAQRLYQFPLGVFGIAIATAVFPALARSSDDPESFNTTLHRGIRLSLFIAVPASVGLLLVRDPLVGVLYTGHGSAFSAEGAARAGDVLLGYSGAIWAYALNQLLTRAFYARGDTTTPMRVALLMVGLNVTLNVALIWWLREAGLAWSTCVCAILQAGVLAWLLCRRTGPLLTDAVRGSVLRTLTRAALMGGAVWGVLAAMPSPESWTDQLVTLAVGIAVGAGVYGGLSLLMRAEELAWFRRE